MSKNTFDPSIFNDPVASKAQWVPIRTERVSEVASGETYLRETLISGTILGPEGLDYSQALASSDALPMIDYLHKDLQFTENCVEADVELPSERESSVGWWVIFFFVLIASFVVLVMHGSWAYGVIAMIALIASAVVVRPFRFFESMGKTSAGNESLFGESSTGNKSFFDDISPYLKIDMNSNTMLMGRGGTQREYRADSIYAMQIIKNKSSDLFFCYFVFQDGDRHLFRVYENPFLARKEVSQMAGFLKIKSWDASKMNTCGGVDEES